MADILSDLSKMTDIEIQVDKPLTEALFAKLGANINALIDRLEGVEVFTSSGTFTVPDRVSRIFLLGCGGGGGGGGGSMSGGRVNGSELLGGGGGAGGTGSSPEMMIIEVVPLTLVPVTIGAGGNGGASSTGIADNSGYGYTGANGGDTIFGTLARFSGGLGGAGGTFITYPPDFLGGVLGLGFGGPGVASQWRPMNGLVGSGAGGKGGNSPPPGGQVAGSAGERSIFALGGTGGPTGGTGGGGGGGGGGAAFGAGGNGGAGRDGGTISVLPTAGGIGAGGGGAGGGDNATANVAGGNGGNGIVIVGW